MADNAQHFDDGAAYERRMARWTRAAGRTFLAWVAPPSNARWLDVGCGTGVFTELLAETCSPAAVAGVDPSEPQIELARSKPIADRTDFRTADAETLPFSDEAFDVVVSALVINFISDRPRALAEMRRVCRPGGVIAGYVWDFAAQRSPSSPIRFGLGQVGATPPPVPGTEASRIDGLISLFAGVKLTDIATQVTDVTMSFPDFNAFWQSQVPVFGSTGKMIAALSKSDREKVMGAVRARLPGGPDGSVTCSARAHAVKARVPE